MFEITPRLILIASSINYNSGGIVFLPRGVSFYNNGNIKIAGLQVKLSNKTISWYCDSINGQVGNQLGTKDGRYNYLAFLLN